MATTRMERVRPTAGCCHTSKLVDSRIAEPSGSCEQLPGGSCRCGQSRLARSRLGGLLVEARTKQLVLCLLVPVPVVPPCSFTHNALLENENGWRSAGTANRVCDCGGVLLRKKRRAVCCHASRVRESPVAGCYMGGQAGAWHSAKAYCRSLQQKPGAQREVFRQDTQSGSDTRRAP